MSTSLRLCAAAVILWMHTPSLPAHAGADIAPAGMKEIPAGIYRPLFVRPDEAKEVPVGAFLVGIHPVTNAEFLEFVRENPKWQRSAVKRLFTDKGYLQHWQGDLDVGGEVTERAQQPVTNVSWFAAKAYCGWKGGRLPTTAEWEMLGAA